MLQSGGQKQYEGPHVGRLATSPLLSPGSRTHHSGKQNQNRAQIWADWLHHPCCLGGPQRFQARDKIRGGSTCGQISGITLPVSGVPIASENRSGNKIGRGPTCGQIGYITSAVSGVPFASQRGTKSGVGPLVRGLATSSMISRGYPLLQSRGTTSQEGPHEGESATRALAVASVPKASKRGTKSE